jgi:hypothetical protein
MGIERWSGAAVAHVCVVLVLGVAVAGAQPPADPVASLQVRFECAPKAVALKIDGVSLSCDADPRWMSIGNHVVEAKATGHEPLMMQFKVQVGMAMPVSIRLKPSVAVPPPARPSGPASASTSPPSGDRTATADEALGPDCRTWFETDGLVQDPAASHRRFDCAAALESADGALRLAPAFQAEHEKCQTVRREMAVALSKWDGTGAWRAALAHGALGTKNVVAAGQQWAELSRNIGAGRLLSPEQLTALAELGAAPALGTAERAVREALCARAGEWFATLGTGDERTQDQRAAGLVWVERILWASPDWPVPATVVQALAGAGRGEYSATSAPWNHFPAERAVLAEVVALARRRALDFHWRQLELAVRQDKIDRALAALGAGTQIALADDRAWQDRLATLKERFRTWREKRLAALRTATNPGGATAAWDGLVALDFAIDGPLARESTESHRSIRAALEGVLGGAIEAHFERLGETAFQHTDAGRAAHGLLLPKVVTWGTEKLADPKALERPDETRTLGRQLLAATRDHAAIQAAVTAFEGSARAARIARYDAVFAAGYTAAALWLTQTATDLTDDDRAFLVRKWKAEIATVGAGAQPALPWVVADSRAERVAAAAARTTVRSGNGPYLLLEVRAHRAQPGTVVRTENGTSRYLAGTQRGANPDLATCHKEHSAAQAAALTAREAQERLQADYDRCMSSANALAGRGGWAGAVGIIGGSACVAIDVSVAVEARSAASKADALARKCASMPREVNVERWEDYGYSVRFVAAEATGLLVLKLIDPAAAGSGEVWEKSQEARWTVEDRVVDPAPQFGVEGDPMTLPSPMELEAFWLAEAARTAQMLAGEADSRKWSVFQARAAAATTAEERWENVATLHLLIASRAAPGDALSPAVTGTTLRDMQALLRTTLAKRVPAKNAFGGAPPGEAIPSEDAAEPVVAPAIREATPSGPPGVPAPAKGKSPGARACGGIRFTQACAQASGGGECEGFVAATPSVSCATVCEAVGSVCVDAWDDKDGGCGHGSSLACDRRMGSFVCRCGPP